MPNPFQRVSVARRRIDAAGWGVGAGMATRREKLAGQPTTSAERPTRFNGFRLSDAELIRRAGAWGWGWRRGWQSAEIISDGNPKKSFAKRSDWFALSPWTGVGQFLGSGCQYPQRFIHRLGSRENGGHIRIEYNHQLFLGRLRGKTIWFCLAIV